MKRIICIAVLALAGLGVQAQPEMLDRIVAIVGDEIILESDVNDQYTYVVESGQKDDGTLRCRLIEELIMQKLMLNKAEQDSLVVSEGQVDGEVNRRLDLILQQMNGSEQEFRGTYGMSTIEFKEFIREDIHDRLLIRQQESAIYADAEITPRQVKKFFRSINPDSLGLLPAEVQFNQIVIKVPWAEDSEEAIKEAMGEYRKQIVEGGADFSDLARRYSEEPGASRSGGRLPEFTRGMMVPEFEEMAFNMREGDVSEAVKTEFGYHLIKLDKRNGEMITARHILRKPELHPKGDSIAIARLNEIRELIDSDSLTFEIAAILYSDDRQTKDCGGCYTNPETGELTIPLDKLPADYFFKIDEMEEGEISEPLKLENRDGSVSYHIIYLKKKIPPHVPNLTDDYKTIYAAALRAERGRIFEDWLESAKKNIYIDIKPTECANALQNWIE